MSSTLAVVAATEKEIAPFVGYLRQRAAREGDHRYRFRDVSVDVVITGIGVMQATYSLLAYFHQNLPGGWIQAGIGGAFDPALETGRVYRVESEMVAGFGAEQQDGLISDPFELGWSDPDAYPYRKGKLVCPYTASVALPSATGMTTFLSHGHTDHIALLRKSPHAQIENMEGAAFFYISLLHDIPFLSLRAISNKVEARDLSKWNIPLSIQNLNFKIQNLIETLNGSPASLFIPVRDS